MMSMPWSNVVRYTEIPLPLRRFLPGDAHDHSIPELLGAPGAPGEQNPHRLRPPDQWRNCTAYLYGCDLYNHGYWWEAHEIWEDLWHQAARQPQPRLQHAFLQGLIQVAACAIKLEQHKSRGLAYLLTTSHRHLGRVIDHVGDDHYMGLPLRTWRDSVQRYYAEATQHDERFPLIDLQ
jgi:uncharacterized protein